MGDELLESTCENQFALARLELALKLQGFPASSRADVRSAPGSMYFSEMEDITWEGNEDTYDDPEEQRALFAAQDSF